MARKENLMIKKLTPVLFVEKIEPVLPFWTEHLGFVKTVEVPDGDRLAFVILQQGTVEVMYQTYASVEKDLPAILPDVRKPALKSAAVYLPERNTFYGAREIGVRDPAGHFLTFAQLVSQGDTK